MTKKIFATLIFFTSFSLSVFCQENEETIVTQFENIVTNITHFFDSDPLFLDQQTHFFLYKHYHPVEVSYDIKKTESIISPYIGLISVEVPIKKLNEYHGYLSITECLADTDFANVKTDGGRLYVTSAHFTYTYSYQKGKWTFKGIRAYGNEIYDDDWNRKENQHWIDAATKACDIIQSKTIENDTIINVPKNVN